MNELDIHKNISISPVVDILLYISLLFGNLGCQGSVTAENLWCYLKPLLYGTEVTNPLARSTEVCGLYTVLALGQDRVTTCFFCNMNPPQEVLPYFTALTG